MRHQQPPAARFPIRHLRLRVAHDHRGAPVERRHDGRLLPPDDGPHHLPRGADLRRCGQHHPGAAALPGIGRSGEGHPALHQFAGRIGLGRSGHLRHDAAGELRRGDDLHGAGRLDGRSAAHGRYGGQAFGAAAFARDDPPAAGRRAGTGVGHRDHGPRNPAHEARTVRNSRLARRRADQEDRKGCRPRLLDDGRRSQELRPDRRSAEKTHVPRRAPKPARTRHIPIRNDNE